MTAYSILPCRASHIAELARTIRAEDRAEIEGAGFHPKHLMFALYWRSDYRRTALVDGAVAACWGDAGGTLDLEAVAWLFTTPAVERVPLAFFRETRREVAAMLARRTALRADTAAGYGRALRFFALQGFAIGEPRALGPGGELYRQISIERAE